MGNPNIPRSDDAMGESLGAAVRDAIFPEHPIKRIASLFKRDKSSENTQFDPDRDLSPSERLEMIGRGVSPYSDIPHREKLQSCISNGELTQSAMDRWITITGIRDSEKEAFDKSVPEFEAFCAMTPAEQLKLLIQLSVHTDRYSTMEHERERMIGYLSNPEKNKRSLENSDIYRGESSFISLEDAHLDNLTREILYGGEKSFSSRILRSTGKVLGVLQRYLGGAYRLETIHEYPWESLASGPQSFDVNHKEYQLTLTGSTPDQPGSAGENEYSGDRAYNLPGGKLSLIGTFGHLSHGEPCSSTEPDSYRVVVKGESV